MSENEPYLNLKLHGADASRVLDRIDMLLDEVRKAQTGDVFELTLKLERTGNIFKDSKK